MIMGEEPVFLSANLWRLIFETAPDEEVKYVLHEAELSIPGFRPDKIRTVHRALVIKTMIQTKNGKKIREVYNKLLETNLDQHLKIDNTLRKKIIQLILTGDNASIGEAEELGEQLAVEYKKDSHIEDSTKIPSEQNDVQEWQERYKILEKETKKKLQSLEKKCEKKVQEVIEFKKKIAFLEKRHEGEIRKIQEDFSKAIEERDLYKKNIEELQQTTKVLKNEFQRKEDEIHVFNNTVKSYKEENENYRQRLDELLLKYNNIDKYIIPKDLHIRENDECIESPDNKTKILVIGETFYKQENLKTFDLEFIHAQQADAEEIEKRSDLATFVVLLSWTMTMAMQRKIKKIIPNEKLNEFNDYSTFQDYVKEEERMSYASS